jgi:hypothetical protein
VTARIPLAPRSLALAIAVAIPFAALFANAGTASAAETKCPNTFQVLHNDHIGKLSLRAGHYTITLLRNQGPGCGKAANLFAKFLQDFDGNLPHGWKVVPARKEFVRRNTGVGFRVTRGTKSGGGGGKHPSGNGKRCPATFKVQHNDRIGRLKLRAGNYRITRLTNANPDCQKAAKLFARFLQHPDGQLPDHWRVHAKSGTFTRGGTEHGFRVKPA